MAKMTLLDIVKDILNDIDGDEVNSIDDTIESSQVAQIVKTTFELMIANRDWPHTKGLIQFVASADPAKPTYMTLGPEVKKVVSVNYNKVKGGETRLKYQPVKYINTDDFLRMVNGRNSDEDNIDSVVDESGITLLIRNDLAPSYYTSFDDENIIFDSYDSEVDSTLQASKVQAIGYSVSDFVLADDTVADLPTEAFGLLLEESKSKASLKLRQTQDVKAELESQKAQGWLSKNAWTVDGGVKYYNYGRGRGRTIKSSKETNGT